MAPVNNVVPAVNRSNQDVARADAQPSARLDENVSVPNVALVEKAAWRLIHGISPDVRTEILHQASDQLLRDQSRRIAKNLNHWERYAPARSRELVKRAVDTRNARIGQFIKSNEKAMWEQAWRITRNRYLAEKAIVRTCRELWEGRTREDVFFRALKMNARDEMVIRNLERDRCRSLDTARFPQPSTRSEFLRDLEVEPDQADFASPWADDQNPMEILIQREEKAELGRLVAQAFKDPRWRYVKRRQWAAPLRVKCAELEVSFE